MRERLRDLGDWWFTEACPTLRQLAPPNGRPYELWDTSIYLAYIALIGWVVYPAPITVTTGLAPLAVVSEADLGLFVAIMALLGVALSYGGNTWLTVGYALPTIGALFMAANFAISVLAVAGTHWGWWDAVAPGVAYDQSMRASLLYVMIFGWPARRLKRDNRSGYER